MANLRYLDFDLALDRSGDQQYLARVLQSPVGPATHTFTLPFSAIELENFCLKIGRPRRGVRRLESPEMAAAKNFGKALFASVFDDEVMGCFRSSLDHAEARGLGLRIRLRLNAPELIDLPWEYLYYPALNRFLVLAVQTPLVRFVDLPQRSQPLMITPPLRILVMISNPVETSGLDTEHEWQQLNAALAKSQAQGRVELERLPNATLATLHAQLRRGPYHIFHFIGHGVFDETAQDGMLLLEDEHGRSQRVSGQKLGTLLQNHRHLRLAVLNACEGARVSRNDPFAGAALSLVQQSIPAVIAMQFEITDQAAVTFAGEFYRALAEGCPVDMAMVEARLGIYAMGNDVEWGTPVLYLHAPDGQIFAPPRLTKVDERGSKIKALAQAASESVKREDWNNAIARFDQVLALDPQNVEAQRMRNLAEERKRLAHSSAHAKPDEHPELWRVARRRAKKLATNVTHFIEAEMLTGASRLARKILGATALAFLKTKPGILFTLFAALGMINLLFEFVDYQTREDDSKRQELCRRLIVEGDAFFAQRDFAQAQQKYQEAWKKFPEDSVARNKFTRCAQELASAAEENKKKRLHTRILREADSLFIRSAYAEARARYRQALAQNPNDRYLLEQINFCEQKLVTAKQDSDAVLLYGKCLTRARAMLEQKDYFSAKKLYEQALRHKPEDIFATQQVRLCEKALAQTQTAAPEGIVLIPSGVFLMGSNGGNKDEQPLREVQIAAFYMDKYEVTVAQYQHFLREQPSSYRAPENWVEQLQYPQRPVVYVSWENARAFCRWRAEKNAVVVRLPTEAEWEYAARGGAVAKKYPWGDLLNITKANFDTDQSRVWNWESAKRHCKEVGSYAANKFGLHDMAGNVWEWCADWYSEDYYQNRARPDRNPSGPARGSTRVLRGGSWFGRLQNLRCSNRNHYTASTRTPEVGFRCVQEKR